MRYIIWGYKQGDQDIIVKLVNKYGGKVIEKGSSEPYVIADIDDSKLPYLYRSGYVRLVEKEYGGFR